jgi:hypothetical protein
VWQRQTKEMIELLSTELDYLRQQIDRVKNIKIREIMRVED